MGSDPTANVERFSGFADQYDAYRPEPPIAIVEILTQWAQTRRPRLVVDLGSGTGLSTRIWAGHAESVVGVEPNDDMRRAAERRTAELPDAGNVRYVKELSTKTGLPTGSADVVTCSQSLHWMDPAPTFAEAARILRPGGVFAAYDCDWPPTMHWEAEGAYIDVLVRVRTLERERSISQDVTKWGKSEHLTRMRQSGRFRFVREILLHNTEPGNAERLVGLARSQGSVATLLKHGLTEADIGLDTLRSVAERTLGDGSVPWHFSYRVRCGVV